LDLGHLEVRLLEDLYLLEDLLDLEHLEVKNP
jgi:hypothetical protein